MGHCYRAGPWAVENLVSVCWGFCSSSMSLSPGCSVKSHHLKVSSVSVHAGHGKSCGLSVCLRAEIRLFVARMVWASSSHAMQALQTFEAAFGGMSLVAEQTPQCGLSSTESCPASANRRSKWNEEGFHLRARNPTSLGTFRSLQDATKLNPCYSLNPSGPNPSNP